LTLMLYTPSSWRFVSIDPIMEFDVGTLPTNIQARLTVVRSISQDYAIDEIKPGEHASGRRFIDIVVACHSHAPITEFWQRLEICRKPEAVMGDYYRLCASLPCCGKDWSLIKDVCPIEEYEDYEVLSARRRVFLYAEKC
jgi:hypothetical protein